MLDHQFKPLTWFQATVVPGYQIASGLAKDNPFGDGSLCLQLPLFCQAGLPFKRIYPGTLNLDISPFRIQWIDYWYCVHQLKWHPQFAAESFAFCPCKLDVCDNYYQGFVYYPLPETKLGHHHNPAIVEVISEFIPDVCYRDTIKVSFPKQYINVIDE
ncbi:hypothetical protein [Thalassotalea litorea]|uniref:hypothetical protein n=1 Tax=Thalassotalea litorea TaxID=2020715 RepID=UPI003735DBCA